MLLSIKDLAVPRKNVPASPFLKSLPDLEVFLVMTGDDNTHVLGCPGRSCLSFLTLHTTGSNCWVYQLPRQQGAHHNISLLVRFQLSPLAGGRGCVSIKHSGGKCSWLTPVHATRTFQLCTSPVRGIIAQQERNK